MFAYKSTRIMTCQVISPVNIWIMFRNHLLTASSITSFYIQNLCEITWDRGFSLGTNCKWWDYIFFLTYIILLLKKVSQIFHFPWWSISLQSFINSSSSRRQRFLGLPRQLRQFYGSHCVKTLARLFWRILST